MDLSRENVLQFLACVALYGLYFFRPRISGPWKEAQRKLAGWREYEVHVEAPSEASRVLLSKETFNPKANTLGSLGFEYLGDYVVRAGVRREQVSSSAPLASPRAANPKQFLLLTLRASRVFIHRDHRCVAFVSAVSSRGTTPLIQITSQGEGWTYTSEASAPLNGNAGRLPRDLKSFHGSLSTRQLLEAHLECRARIAQVGGFNWGEPPTMQDIFASEESHAAYVREFAGRHSPFSLWFWERRVNRHGGDWMGELAGKATLPKTST